MADSYGCEVQPNGPRQDMNAIDTIAGSGPHDRTASPAAFTGGDNEAGFGGTAEGTEPPKAMVP